MKLQMYELENGSVKLQAEKLCTIQITLITWYYHNMPIPVFETYGSGGTRIYQYEENEETIIAIESNTEKFYFGDGKMGTSILFMKVCYDGQKWIELGSDWYSGSDISQEEIVEHQNHFLTMGLTVDYETIFTEKKYIMDYINNPVLIGQSNYETSDNLSDTWSKIGCISFARQ